MSQQQHRLPVTHHSFTGIRAVTAALGLASVLAGSGTSVPFSFVPYVLVDRGVNVTGSIATFATALPPKATTASVPPASDATADWMRLPKGSYHAAEAYQRPHRRGHQAQSRNSTQKLNGECAMRTDGGRGARAAGICPTPQPTPPAVQQPAPAPPAASVDAPEKKGDAAAPVATVAVNRRLGGDGRMYHCCDNADCSPSSPGYAGVRGFSKLWLLDCEAAIARGAAVAPYYFELKHFRGRFFLCHTQDCNILRPDCNSVVCPPYVSSR